MGLECSCRNSLPLSTPDVGLLRRGHAYIHRRRTQLTVLLSPPDPRVPNAVTQQLTEGDHDQAQTEHKHTLHQPHLDHVHQVILEPLESEVRQRELFLADFPLVSRPPRVGYDELGHGLGTQDDKGKGEMNNKKEMWYWPATYMYICMSSYRGGAWLTYIPLRSSRQSDEAALLCSSGSWC